MMRLAAAFVALAATAARAQSWEAERDQVLVTAQVSTGARQVSFVSRALEWSLIDGEEGDRVRLRIPLASFESGHSAADAAWPKAGTIEVEGVVQRGRLTGTASVNGASRPFEAAATLARTGSQRSVHMSFVLDLHDFGIALPGMGARATVDLDAMLSATGVVAGGAIGL